MPSFGNSSTGELITCCPEIQLTLNTSIEMIDYSVICGARSKETQNHAFDTGASHLQWPNSKHNVTKDRPLSDAVDIWPYTKRWGALSGHPSQIAKIATHIKKPDEPLHQAQQRAREYVYKAFAHTAGVNQGIAKVLGYALRWGGDWNGNGDMLDQNFHDLPHLEIVRTRL